MEITTMKVLIVDDSTVMRKVLVEALTRLNIREVCEVPNGMEAVVALSRDEFDLILMDWNMPRMTGVEAIREIRSRGFGMPIIMVTTEADKVRVLEALKAGANNYLIKPFTHEAMGAKIRETMKAKAG
jgi:two-component system chemotaxis response regulator CheY